MPTALSKPDRPAQWGLHPGQDSCSLPCPLYSGHLLKLGSNDRWQSRLFTFDGSGKKPKAPVIMTYDPYVSSPFQSSSCHPRPLNPNTKWYIEMGSITAIKLLPVTRTYRCFPYSDISKELSIQTNDGRNMTLRASKDVEIERWYFVLSKIWELQQTLESPALAGAAAKMGAEDGATPYATKNLAAHQQSAQLFQRYLQKQYHSNGNHNIQKDCGGVDSISPLNLPLHSHLRSQQKKPRESFLPYEIPPPPRVSAFLPQGFEWSLHDQGDEDSFPIGYKNNTFGYLNSRSAPGEKERSPVERQTSWSHQSQQSPMLPASSSIAMAGTRLATATAGGKNEALHPTVADMYHERFACPTPAAGSMEPGKAASIDNWRRSLHIPVLVDSTTASPSHVAKNDHARAMTDQDNLPLVDSLESALKRASLGLDMAACNNIESGGLHSATIVSSPITDLNHWANAHDYDYTLTKNDLFAAQQQQDEIIKRLSIHPNNNNNNNNRYSVIAKEEDELPLGLLQSNRHSRWLNTQLSSDDGSNAREQTPPQPPATRILTATSTHQLLPSEPITPERTPSKNSSAINQLSKLAPLHYENSNLNYFSTATSNSSGNERAPFTVHVPVRQLRRCPSIPPTVSFNNNSSASTKHKKYIPSDTTPYTTLSSSLPHHPPPRPPRPPSIGLNSLAGPDEHLINDIYGTNPLRHNTNTTRLNNNNINNESTQSKSNSPPNPPPVSCRKNSQNRLSALQSFSGGQALSLQSQDIPIHPHQQVNVVMRQNGDNELKNTMVVGHHPFRGEANSHDEDEDEDEDEPLALTLSRQQSLRLHQHRSQLIRPQQITTPQSTLPLAHLQCYEQVTPAASSESVSYY
ncbi:hypothetical protein FBU30_009444 [Linnemannia zychae]|nr:hypothetical protein FBU30_009444 [Linnemannia zychae]